MQYNNRVITKQKNKWYQFVHGCHWINRFTAALISKALNVEVDVWKTDTHTIATFIKDDVIYYADILNKWNSLKELCDFMGKEVDFYSVFDEIKWCANNKENQ